MKDNIVALLNKQVNKEFYSAYLYLNFANFFMEKGLTGFANWYNVQAQEEREHAILLIKYLHNNGAKVVYEAIEKPYDCGDDSLKVLKCAYAHEKEITASINNIYGEAFEAKDYRTLQFLDWFVKEQGEEEAAADEVVKKMELFGSDAKGLYLLDQELGQRVYTAPAANIL